VLVWRCIGFKHAQAVLWLHGSRRTAPGAPDIPMIAYDRPG